MTGLPSPLLLNPSIHAHLIPSLALLHAKCIIDPPYSGGTFLAPLDTTVMETWWASRVAEVSEGFREIIVQFGGQDTEEVVGVVMLSMPVSATAAFKGYVEKLCVSTSFRGRGIARRLVDMLCNVAVERGRPLLMLDTEGGTPAEGIYHRWGWTLIGRIPNGEISAGDGMLRDTVYFYKDLR